MQTIVRDMGYNGTHDDDALRPLSVGVGLTPRGAEHEGSWGRRLAVGTGGRPTGKLDTLAGMRWAVEKEGHKERNYSVLGTLGAGSESGSRSQDPSWGTGRRRTGKRSASRVTACIACCNVSAIKSSLSSYVNSVIVVDHWPNYVSWRIVRALSARPRYQGNLRPERGVTTMLKNKNFEGTMHRNASVNWISSIWNGGATYQIYLNYFSKKIDRDDIEEWKIWWENSQKFIHKLNKHQTERCCHVANLAELFLWKDLWPRQFLIRIMLTKLGQIAMKNAKKIY